MTDADFEKEWKKMRQEWGVRRERMKRRWKWWRRIYFVIYVAILVWLFFMGGVGCTSRQPVDDRPHQSAPTARDVPQPLDTEGRALHESADLAWEEAATLATAADGTDLHEPALNSLEWIGRVRAWLQKLATREIRR